MNGPKHWPEGDPMAINYDHRPVTQGELDAEWAKTVAALKAKGVRFETMDEGVTRDGLRAEKFGQSVTKTSGLNGAEKDGLAWMERGLRDHFGPLEGGTLIVRSAPTAIPKEDGTPSSYVRARFAFRKATT